jgi:hypothetical protein
LVTRFTRGASGDDSVPQTETRRPSGGGVIGRWNPVEEGGDQRVAAGPGGHQDTGLGHADTRKAVDSVIATVGKTPQSGGDPADPSSHRSLI